VVQHGVDLARVRERRATHDLAPAVDREDDAEVPAQPPESTIPSRGQKRRVGLAVASRTAQADDLLRQVEREAWLKLPSSVPRSCISGGGACAREAARGNGRA